MNLLFKYVPGSITYKVSVANSSKKASQLMASFPDSVFDFRIPDENSFVFSCLVFSNRKLFKSGILSDCEVSKLCENGAVGFFAKHKKRFGLLLGIVIFSFVLFFQSTLVWDIQVSGNNSIRDDEIIALLDSAGFSVGKKADRNSLSEIEDRCILSDNRISWMSINMSGTVAFVEIMERTVKSDLSETPSMTGIVALKDCVIELCKATSGTSLVSPGQTVQRGEMLISPIVQGKDGNEYLVGAYGSILARTIEEFYVSVNYYSTVCSFTGDKAAVYEYSFLGKSLKVKPAFVKNINRFIASESKEKIKIFNEITLPMIKNTKKRYEYILSEEIITPEEARKKAYRKMYSKISDVLSDAEILTTEFSELENDDCFVLKCRVECIRDVALSAGKGLYDK